MTRFVFTEFRFLVTIAIANLIAVGVLASIINYNSQRGDIIADEVKDLVVAIHHSDLKGGNQTEKLVNATNNKADRNYLATVKGIASIINASEQRAKHLADLQEQKGNILTNYFKVLISNISKAEDDNKALNLNQLSAFKNISKVESENKDLNLKMIGNQEEMLRLLNSTHR